MVCSTLEMAKMGQRGRYLAIRWAVLHGHTPPVNGGHRLLPSTVQIRRNRNTLEKITDANYE